MTLHRSLILLLLSVLSVLAAPAWAIYITVDGSYSDWPKSGPPAQWDSDDPDEAAIPNSYDIDWNRQTFGRFTNGDLGIFFIVQTVADFNDDLGGYEWGSSARISIGINSKPGGNAREGRPGVDYFLNVPLTDEDGNWLHTFGTTYYKTLRKWSGTAWVNDGTVEFAQNEVPGSAGFFEFGIKHADLENVANFEWFAYLDNGTDPADDYCPDQNYNVGRIPEPGTTALFIVGLGAVALVLRRRRPLGK